jgi:endonuclease YncB( thermonuclease family)
MLVKQNQKLLLPPILVCAAFFGVLCAYLVRPANLSPLTSRAHTTDTSQSYQAKVIAISDGDSLTVRANDQTIRVRLAQIDAPERRQAWGQRSRQVLSQLIGGKTVLVMPHGTDRYGRTLATLTVQGEDINRAMVEKGAAWAYSSYVRDPAIVAAQVRAQAAQQGLWAMPENERIAPWDYRRQQRENAEVMTGR